MRASKSELGVAVPVGAALNERARFHSWTTTDVQTACRQMGYDGGKWWAWLDRQPGHPRPRLLLEAPGCGATEPTVQECPQWANRQMGAGVCGESNHFLLTSANY